MTGPWPSLSPSEAADLLSATPAMIAAEVEAYPAALLRWRPEPTAWCALEALGYLIETEERAFAGRIRQFLGERAPVFSEWDPAAVAAARGDCDADPAVLLAEFSTCREESVRLVSQLREVDLSRGGEHPMVGRLTISDLLHEWVHHDREHLQQILAVLQAAVRPSMGNALRFSEQPGGADCSYCGW